MQRVATRFLSVFPVARQVAGRSLASIAENGFYAQHRPLALNESQFMNKQLDRNAEYKQFISMEWSRPSEPLVDPLEQLLEYYAISILKRRRKKMNKHKWKKHRKAFRDSSRYNKEKRKKKGIVRQKQE